MNWATDKAGTVCELGDRRYVIQWEIHDFVKRVGWWRARLIGLRGNGNNAALGYFQSREAAITACEIYEKGRSK